MEMLFAPCRDIHERKELYFIEAYQQILTTYKWGNTSEFITSELIEKFSRNYGAVGIGRTEETGTLAAFTPSFSGKIMTDGIGEDVEGVTLNGEHVKGKRNVDVAIIFNNSMYFPDTPFLAWYADLFDETDKSIRANLLMSRIMPIGLAADDKTEKSLNKAYDKLMAGDLFAIARVNKIIDEDVFKTEQITNPDNVNKLQYLSLFWDTLQKRLYQKYGIPMTNANNKAAQVNEDEMLGSEFYSQIYLNDTYEMRLRGCEDVNRIFGLDWTVEPSAPFHAAKKSVMEEEENEDVTDEDEEVTETEETEQDNSESESEEEKEDKKDE